MNNLSQKISQLLLQNEKGMVKEQDLKNFCESDAEFAKIIKDIVKNFENLGFSLVRTTFQNEKYYVLTKPGKDPSISPTMYGLVALLIATYNEIGEDIPLSEIKKIFRNSWEEVKLLIEENYLAINERDGTEYLDITPLAKASFKNIAKKIDLKKIIGIIGEK